MTMFAGELPRGTSVIPSSEQRKGEAKAGFDYLTTGNYVGSGIPRDTFFSVFGMQAPNHLKRKGTNAFVPYDYNAVKAPNGVTVVSANCLQCHAQHLHGKLVVGLGNATLDFTSDRGASVPGADLAIALTHGFGSKEYAAYLPFRRAVAASGKHLKTEVMGANPADKLAVVLAAHRDPKTLKWRDQPALPIPKQVVPTDVPPWWHLKKKNAMFYTGSGRGDFARIMMASSLLTLRDTKEAAEVDQQFADVVAYLESLEAPAYPWPVQEPLVKRGKVVFNQRCAECHGTYAAKGSNEADTYPNLLVELKRVRTDPLLAKSQEANEAFLAWYNNSWFATTEPTAQMVSTKGYVAPPLDGIWATAPYLHNGSVPTLEDLLDSEQRPDRWRRSFGTDLKRDYDSERVGWKVERGAVAKNPSDARWLYDTTKPGYGNRGHTFGDKLSAADRKAVVEYLKTL